MYRLRHRWVGFLALIVLVPALLIGSIDIFALWWALVLAIGLGVLYGRRTQDIALRLAAVYAVAALALAVVKTASAIQ